MFADLKTEFIREVSVPSKKKSKGPPPRLPSPPVSKPKPLNWAAGDPLKEARSLDLIGCWINPDWEDSEGLARLAVARRQASERVLYGVFSVDYFCLGVRACRVKADVSEKEFQRSLPELLGGAAIECEPGLAHELVYRAVDYAARYELAPPKEYAQAALILDPPGVHRTSHQLSFGVDGKPYYIPRPGDNPASILASLERTAGAGNYDVKK
jgi:hypothetical protein